LAHFERFAGHEAKIRLAAPIEGRRNFKGRLCGVADSTVLIDVDGQRWCLPIADVVAANLAPEF
jgi:ribosome maturation factor RimP